MGGSVSTTNLPSIPSGGVDQALFASLSDEALIERDRRRANRLGQILIPQLVPRTGRYIRGFDLQTVFPAFADHDERISRGRLLDIIQWTDVYVSFHSGYDRHGRSNSKRVEFLIDFLERENGFFMASSADGMSSSYQGQVIESAIHRLSLLETSKREVAEQIALEASNGIRISHNKTDVDARVRERVSKQMPVGTLQDQKRMRMQHCGVLLLCITEKMCQAVDDLQKPSQVRQELEDFLATGHSELQIIPVLMEDNDWTPALLATSLGYRFSGRISCDLSMDIVTSISTSDEETKHTQSAGQTACSFIGQMVMSITTPLRKGGPFQNHNISLQMAPTRLLFNFIRDTLREASLKGQLSSGESGLITTATIQLYAERLAKGGCVSVPVLARRLQEEGLELLHRLGIPVVHSQLLASGAEEAIVRSLDAVNLAHIDSEVRARLPVMRQSVQAESHRTLDLRNRQKQHRELAQMSLEDLRAQNIRRVLRTQKETQLEAQRRVEFLEVLDLERQALDHAITTLRDVWTRSYRLRSEREAKDELLHLLHSIGDAESSWQGLRKTYESLVGDMVSHDVLGLQTINNLVNKAQANGENQTGTRNRGNAGSFPYGLMEPLILPTDKSMRCDVVTPKRMIAIVQLSFVLRRIESLALASPEVVGGLQQLGVAKMLVSLFARVYTWRVQVDLPEGLKITISPNVSSVFAVGLENTYDQMSTASLEDCKESHTQDLKNVVGVSGSTLVEHALSLEGGVVSFPTVVLDTLRAIGRPCYDPRSVDDALVFLLNSIGSRGLITRSLRLYMDDSSLTASTLRCLDLLLSHTQNAIRATHIDGFLEDKMNILLLQMLLDRVSTQNSPKADFITNSEPISTPESTPSLEQAIAAPGGIWVMTLLVGVISRCLALCNSLPQLITLRSIPKRLLAQALDHSVNFLQAALLVLMPITKPLEDMLSNMSSISVHPSPVELVSAITHLAHNSQDTVISSFAHRLIWQPCGGELLVVILESILLLYSHTHQVFLPHTLGAKGSGTDRAPAYDFSSQVCDDMLKLTDSISHIRFVAYTYCAVCRTYLTMSTTLAEDTRVSVEEESLRLRQSPSRQLFILTSQALTALIHLREDRKALIQDESPEVLFCALDMLRYALNITHKLDITLRQFGLELAVECLLLLAAMTPVLPTFTTSQSVQEGSNDEREFQRDALFPAVFVEKHAFCELLMEVWEQRRLSDELTSACLVLFHKLLQEGNQLVGGRLLAIGFADRYGTFLDTQHNTCSIPRGEICMLILASICQVEARNSVAHNGARRLLTRFRPETWLVRQQLRLCCRANTGGHWSHFYPSAILASHVQSEFSEVPTETCVSCLLTTHVAAQFLDNRHIGEEMLGRLRRAGFACQLRPAPRLEGVHSSGSGADTLIDSPPNDSRTGKTVYLIAPRYISPRAPVAEQKSLTIFPGRNVELVGNLSKTNFEQSAHRVFSSLDVPYGRVNR